MLRRHIAGLSSKIMTKQGRFSIILTINIMHICSCGEYHCESCDVSRRVSLTSRDFCGFWFREVINQKSLSWAEKNGKNADGHNLKCSPMEGFITPRKVAETSTHLHGFEGCHGESFAVSNRASLEFLAFASSVSSKSSIKIAYPERNGMGKTPMVTV